MKRAWVRIALLLLLAPVTWAFIEPARLTLKEHELAPQGWPREQAGLRIALLSDLHTGSPFNGLSKLQRIVATTNAARPDIVVIAGDFISHVWGGTTIPPGETANVLRGLEAPLGVYAVLGNHDHWYEPGAVEAALTGAGIEVLEDRAKRISAGRWQFWLVGIADLWEGDPDVEGAVAQASDAAPALALTHNPDLFPRIPARISLTMAGHTHGGQVYFPLFGHPHVPTIRHQQYVVGHVVEQGRHLFVTPGLGTSMVPIRFFMPSEISVLVLRGSP